MDTRPILDKLDKVKPSGNGAWMACCPAHEDRNPSMRVTDKGDRILLHCYAGCDPQLILAAIGMTYSDLFEDDREHWTPVIKLPGNVALDEARIVMQMAQNKRDSGGVLSGSELQEEREATMRMKSEWAKYQGAA